MSQKQINNKIKQYYSKKYLMNSIPAKKILILLAIALVFTGRLLGQIQGPTITWLENPDPGLPQTLGQPGLTTSTYETETGMSNYVWAVSAAGTITGGQSTNQITVDWNSPTSVQSVKVTYTDLLNQSVSTTFTINYYPFAGPIDATTIPQFVDPLPHFAAGLRFDAKAGGNLVIKATPVQQIALSTGTPLLAGTIGPANPNVGKGTYAAYAISKDGGTTYGLAMWPAQTIETYTGKPLTVEYRNELTGINYTNLNILADQTLMMNGFPQNGNINVDPYLGPIPMVTHLHGGEMPSGSDGGPTGWFMPTGNPLTGPGFAFGASKVSTYPNQQEEATIWYHPHDQGLTRINVYTGLAGFYFIRGPQEEAAKLPGWSGDDLVKEVTPAGKENTFNATAYLPEIELGIQDRMFNENGELYWPVDPTNPDVHPYWTPEFYGDVMVVNGKSWPYLSVAPRKYRFHVLNGCNARFLSMWLENTTDGNIPGAPGLPFTIVSTDGGLLDNPVVIDPSLNQQMLMAPAERHDVIIDFSGVPAGTVFTLRNNANSPYPDGDPIIPGLTDRIMQFVVNGDMVSAAAPNTAGTDKSLVPQNLRAASPLVRLTDFAGKVNATPAVKRQLVLNEVSGAGGPVQVLINNSHFDDTGALPGSTLEFGGPTEIPQEGTVEMVQIINTTVDAHPMHIHLTQWQLVSRQKFDQLAYEAAYKAAWNGAAEFPAGQGYPGGAGSPNPYDQQNTDGALGGNPAITPFLMGAVIPASPDEMGWKDDIISLPGEVATFIVRYAPTDRPLTATAQELLYPFDPSQGPGYVWHCHIIDHEDMDMMRPLVIKPSPLRFPQITVQPVNKSACNGDASVTLSVTASSATTMTYQWQVSNDGGITWANVTNVAPYSGATTASLIVGPLSLTLNGLSYHCLITNSAGTTTSAGALLSVSDCSVSGVLSYNNATLDPLAGMIVTINGKTATTSATGAYTITGIPSGTWPVTVSANGAVAGAINSTDAVNVNKWFMAPFVIPNVKYLAGNVDNNASLTSADATAIQKNFVLKTAFTQGPWVFSGSTASGTTKPAAMNVTVSGSSVANFNILGMCTGDFNGSYSTTPALVSNIQLTAGSSFLIKSNTSFNLPIRTSTQLTVSAVSMIITIPTNLVQVQGAVVNGSVNAATVSVTGTELRIGWNSTTPVTIAAGQPLVTLTLKPLTAFTSKSLFEMLMVQNALNELADGSFMPVSNAALTYDVPSFTTSGQGTLSMTVSPNPVYSSATFSYTLPAAGRVTLYIYNSKGMLVKSLISNQSMLAGSYSLTSNLNSLIKGNYVAMLTLKTSTQTLTKSVNIVKK